MRNLDSAKPAQFLADIMYSLFVQRLPALAEKRAPGEAQAFGRISSGGWNVTPVGFEIGVGSGLRNGPPAPMSHRNNMALSSCMVLWQCSMNMPPQSRNCIRMTTVPLGRKR